MQKQYFGTDGIRGRVGKSPISADWILKLGWAFGKVLGEKLTHQNFKTRSNIVLIGKDTRISGYMFESALEAGLVASGMNINLLGPMPTPAIAYLTRTLKAAAGIVISASHNPYYDNGIKFITADGYKISDELELEIEAMLAEEMITVDSSNIGKAKRIDDAEGRYIEFCKNTLPAHQSLKGMKIVLDCANGATYSVAPNVFRELGAEVISIAVEPNGININNNCGSTHPQQLAEQVLLHKADIGIAFDGDGDRSLMVDHTGAIVDGDEMLFIIAKSYQECGLLNGGVIGTEMSNLGLEIALASHNIDFVRTKVGDRYVLAKLQENAWNLGGESSGHIICSDYNTTGDGIVAALQVISALKTSQKNLFDLKQGMSKFPQVLVNVALTNVSADRNNEILQLATLKHAVSDAETELQGKGRILLRASGTEPLIRIMVEGEDFNKVNLIANKLGAIVKDSLTVSQRAS